MRENCVSSDSSFYICFSDDLNRKDWLVRFTETYLFHLGDRILAEIPDNLKATPQFMSSIRFMRYDYFELIKPYFGRDPKHRDDGEYEAIGIGHHLNDLGLLAFLILDDARAKNFVKTHLPHLSQKMVGTLGFLRDCCCRDKTIGAFEAIAILYDIKQRVEIGGETRPCGMDKTRYNEVLMPIIDEIRRKAGLSV